MKKVSKNMSKSKRLIVSVICFLLCIICWLIVYKYPTGNWIAPVVIFYLIFPPLLALEAILGLCTYRTSERIKTFLSLQFVTLAILLLITIAFISTNTPSHGAVEQPTSVIE